MPKQVDHEQRRVQLADALWRIAAQDGIEAATVRRVAAEAGVSVGMVQHYFTTKDEMLQFALHRVGEDLTARLTSQIRALPEPRDPYDVVSIVLRERLPLTAHRRLHAQAMVAWLGRAVLRPELAEYTIAGTRQIHEYLADQLRRAELPDPDLSAAGLLALSEGMAAQLLQGVHSKESAQAVIAGHLERLFAESSGKVSRPK